MLPAARRCEEVFVWFFFFNDYLFPLLSFLNLNLNLNLMFFELDVLRATNAKTGNEQPCLSPLATLLLHSTALISLFLRKKETSSLPVLASLAPAG